MIVSLGPELKTTCLLSRKTQNGGRLDPSLADRHMLVEVAKPVTLVACILSLLAVFHTAFLAPFSDIDQRIYDTLARLALAATTCLISGLIFRQTTLPPHARSTRLTATLPVQVFCWASGTMLILFVVSWYLESHCIFYRDVRF